MPQVRDSRSVPFNVDATYATGGGTSHGRKVNISIIILS
jgi:hypothetical protein